MFYLDLLFYFIYFYLAALDHECLVTSWPENSNDTSHVNVKTNVPGPIFITGRGLWQDFLPMRSKLNLWAMHRKKQPVQSDYTSACWLTQIPWMLCGLSWLLGLCFSLHCEKIHLQTLGGYTTLLGKYGHQMHREFPQQLLTADSGFLLLTISTFGLHIVAC